MSVTNNVNTKVNTDVSNSVSNSQASQCLVEVIDLNKWADQSFVWQGALPLSFFERIKELTLDKPHDDLQMNCELKKVRDILWLSFTVDGTLWLECQRCLNPVAVVLNKSHQMALIKDDSQISALDESVDYLMLDEVIIEQGKQQLLPLTRLIEDEVLLDLPLSPKHEDCEMAVEQVGEIVEEEPENPFAALAGLKGQL